MATRKREPSSDSLILIGPRSEYVKKYPVHQLPKRQSYKPSNDFVRNEHPLDDVTTNKRDYPIHPLEKRRNYKPPNESPRSDARIDSVTINKRDFPAHPVSRIPLAQRAPENIVIEGKHDFSSTYKNQFIDQPVERRRPFKPSSDRPNLDAFDAEPSYKADYPEWKLPEKRVREKIEWNPPEQPVQSTTTNISDYPVHQISPRVDFSPNKDPMMSDEPFQANSNYKETFKAHELPAKVQRERETWTKPSERFETSTTQQRDFRGEYKSPTKSMRPDREPYRSDAPFDSNTTAANSYKFHDLPKRYKHEYEIYQRPDGNMDLNTTNATQFLPHDIQQRKIMPKPSSSDILKGKGAFMGETSYHNTFIGKNTQRVPNMKPKNEYEPPTQPMESNTVNKSDFHMHQIPPRKSYKPIDQPIQHDDPFDDKTDYKEKFKQYEVTQRVPRQREEYIGSTVPLDAVTTSKDSYKGIYQAKRPAMHPDRTPIHSDAAFEGTTTMNSDFQKLDVPQRYFRKAPEYQKPDGTMDMTTTNSVNFLPHTTTKHKITKPGSSGILRGQGEFSKTTNYSGDYFPRQIDRVKLMKPENLYEPPTVPVETRTTNNLDFSHKEGTKRQSYKPVSEIVKSDNTFYDRTDYRDRFVQHELTPRKMRDKQVHEPPSAPLEAKTTAKDSYTGVFQDKRQSFKPNEAYTRSDIPFEQSTTAGASFKAWPTEPRYIHKANEYVKPEGHMDLTTMNRETYKEVKGERAAMHRLKSSNLLTNTGKFDATTSYSGDYIPKPMQGRKNMKPNQDYVPPTVPFGNHTEYRSKLVGYYAPKEKSFKPGNALSDTLGQRDQGNPYRVRQQDWREMLNINTDTSTVA